MGFNDINLQVSGPQQPASTYKTKVLKGQVPFATQVTEPSTKYVIKHNFVLNGDVTIPENCILEFDGGSLSGIHTLTGVNTSINAGLVKIFSTDITLAGTWNAIEAYPEWFGAKADGITDCSPAFNALVNKFCYSVGVTDISCIPIKLGKGTYILSSPIIIPLNHNQYTESGKEEAWMNWKNSFTIIGSGIMTTILKASTTNIDSIFKSDEELDYITNNRLKFFNLKDLTISGSFVCPTCFNNWHSLQIFSNNFENVTFTEFADIAVDVTRMKDHGEYVGQNAECNWRNVRFMYNYIGMKIDSASCSFYGCRWERNYYQGLVITSACAAISFYEALIQYNVNIEEEYASKFKALGSYPGNLVFDKAEKGQISFYGSYFEPSFDRVDATPNYAPIRIIQTEGGYCPRLSIQDSYFGMFTNFIEVVKENGNCSLYELNIKNLKVIRYNQNAYIINKTGGYFDIQNCYFDVFDASKIAWDAVLPPNENYNDLVNVHITIPSIGTRSNMPGDTDLIGLGQCYYDNEFNLYLFRRTHPTTTSQQRWVDSRGFSPAQHKGTTADRPLTKLEDPTNGLLDLNFDVGFDYFDTDLGKYIYAKDFNSNHVTWVDATGATV